MTQQDQIIVKGKCCGKFVKKRAFGSTLIPVNKTNGSSSSGPIQRREHEFIQTYYGGKCPAIDVCRCPHTLSNISHHAHNKVPRKIIISDRGSCCTIRGGFVRHYNEFQERDELFIMLLQGILDEGIRRSR